MKGWKHCAYVIHLSGRWMERVHLSEVEPLASKAQKEGTHIIHNLILFHTCLPAHALTTTKKLLYFLQLKGSHAQHLGSIEQCFLFPPIANPTKIKSCLSHWSSLLRVVVVFLRVFVIWFSFLNFTGKFDCSVSKTVPLRFLEFFFCFSTLR